MSDQDQNNWEERITPTQFLAENPGLEHWVADLRPEDGIYRYRISGEGGGCEGYHVVRAGVVVKYHNTLNWDNAAKHMVLLWAGERPTPREIAAARQIDPGLRDRPVAEVRSLLGESPGCWDVGGAWSGERPRVEQIAKQYGVRYEFRCV